jgi:uncharacterized membrane protein
MAVTGQHRYLIIYQLLGVVVAAAAVLKHRDQAEMVGQVEGLWSQYGRLVQEQLVKVMQVVLDRRVQVQAVAEVEPGQWVKLHRVIRWQVVVVLVVIVL